MQIQISWLLQKPTDLDLHFLQRQCIPGFSRTRVKGSKLSSICSPKCDLGGYAVLFNPHSLRIFKLFLKLFGKKCALELLSGKKSLRSTFYTQRGHRRGKSSVHIPIVHTHSLAWGTKDTDMISTWKLDMSTKNAHSGNIKNFKYILMSDRCHSCFGSFCLMHLVHVSITIEN